MGNFLSYGLHHKNIFVKMYTILLIFWFLLLFLVGITEKNIGMLLVGLIFLGLPFAIPLIYFERKQNKSEDGLHVIKKSEEKSLISEQKLNETCPVCQGEVFEINKKGFFGTHKEIQCKSCNSKWENQEELLKVIATVKDMEDREKELNNALENKQLPILAQTDSNIILKKNEIIHLSAPTLLIEEGKKRKYHSGRVGFRVAKGVWVGGTQGYSESYSVMEPIDAGEITLTNQSLVFKGSKFTRNYLLKNIQSIQRYIDAIEISVENRQKLQIFKVVDSEKWDLFIRTAIENLEK